MTKAAALQQNLSARRQVISTPVEATQDSFLLNRSDELRGLLTSSSSIPFIRTQISQWQKQAEESYGTAEGTLFARIKTTLKSIIKDKNSDLEMIKRVFSLAEENNFLSFEERNNHLIPALIERLEREIKKELAGDNTSIAKDLEREFELQTNGKSIRGELTKPQVPAAPQAVARRVIHNPPKAKPIKEDFSPPKIIEAIPKPITAKRKEEPSLIPEEKDLSSDENLIKFLVNSSSANSSSEALYDLLSNAGRGFEPLADEFLEHMTGSNLNEIAFDKTAQKILGELAKFDKVQLSEIQKVTRQLKNAKLEITLGQIFSIVAPKDESAKDYRLAISNLLNADLPLKTYETNLSLLKSLAEIKRMGGEAEIKLLQDLANSGQRQSTIDTIQKRLTHFSNIQTLIASKIEVPKALTLNPDNEKNQAIALKAVSFKAHEKNQAINYLTFEACKNPDYKRLAEEFDTLTNQKAEPDYKLRAEIIELLQNKSSGHKFPEDDRATESFIKNLIKLMKQKDPRNSGKIIGVFGADKMFHEVYKTHCKTRSKPNNKTFTEFMGHYWNVEKALKLMNEGKYIAGISFRTYEELNAELEKAKENLSLDITTRPDLSGAIHSSLDIEVDSRTHKRKIIFERELDIVYIDGDQLKFGETKKSLGSGKLRDQKNNQSESLRKIAEQYDADFEPLIENRHLNTNYQ